MNTVELTGLLGAAAALITAGLSIWIQTRSRLTHRQVQSVASFEKLNDGLDREVRRLQATADQLQVQFDTCRTELYKMKDIVEDIKMVLTPQQRHDISVSQEHHNYDGGRDDT